jgi:multiple sugar transport system substrate-binding protein
MTARVTPTTRRDVLRRGGQVGGFGILGGLAAACGVGGGSTPGADGAQPRANAAPSEITYQTFFPQQRLDIMEPGFKVFREQNPNVKLNVVFDADHRNKLNTQIAADSGPDLFIHDVWSTARYVDAGAVMDMTARLKVDKIDLARDYYLIGVEQWCGKTFAYPFYITSMLLAYNKDLLRKYGAPDPWDRFNGKWDWNDFLAIARQVTQAPGGEFAGGSWGLAMDGNGVDNIDRNYQVWMTSNGGETYDVEKMRYTLDDPKTIEAYDFLVKLVNDHKVMLGPIEAAEFAKSFTGERFVSGAIAFAQESTGRLTLYQQQIGTKFEWDVVPFPTGTKSLPFIGHSDADTTQVYAKGKSLDASYAAAKFIGGEVMQKIMAENKLLIPALRKAAEDKNTFLKPPPKHVDAFLEPLRSGLFRTSFYHNNGLQALSPIQSDQMKAAMARQKTAREAMLEANRAANDVVKYGNCRQTVTWKKR